MPPISHNPVLKLLQKNVVPWIREHGMERVIIARPLARQMAKSSNIRITPTQRIGKRVGARGKNYSEILANWPDDNQVETRTLQLVFVVSGQADLHLGNYLLHCSQGDAVFIPSGVPKPTGPHPHLEGDNRINGTCDLLWFRPLGQRMQAWICHSRGHQHISAQTKEILFAVDDRITRIFSDIEVELALHRTGYKEICSNLLRAFLLLFQRDVEDERFFFPSSAPENESDFVQGYDPIDRAQHYIRDHLHEKLTIESVARVVRLSRAQFAKLFRQKTGNTFNTFVTQCRLEQAVVMLRETDFTLVYICRVLGYRSPTYFNSLFKRHFGVSPLEFRAQNKRR